MDTTSQKEFQIDKLSVAMDEKGFVLTFRSIRKESGEAECTFRARIPARGLLKLIMALFQAGITYQDTFGTNIGFPVKEGVENEEQTVCD